MAAVGAWTEMGIPPARVPAWGLRVALALGSLWWVVGELEALGSGRYLNALLPVRCYAAGHGLPVL